MVLGQSVGFSKRPIAEPLGNLFLLHVGSGFSAPFLRGFSEPLGIISQTASGQAGSGFCLGFGADCRLGLAWQGQDYLVESLFRARRPTPFLIAGATPTPRSGPSP